MLGTRLARTNTLLGTTRLVFESECEVAASRGTTAIAVPSEGTNPRVLAAAYAGSLTP